MNRLKKIKNFMSKTNKSNKIIEEKLRTLYENGKNLKKLLNKD